MAYSPDGYRMACELVMPHILKALESLKPGTAQGIIDSVAREASEGLDKEFSKSLMEALSITAELEEKPREPSPPATPEQDEEQWLIDPDYAPATLEGQAAARLAITVVMSLLYQMDKRFEGEKLIHQVLEGEVLRLSQVHENGTASVLDTAIFDLIRKYLRYANANWGTKFVV